VALVKILSGKTLINSLECKLALADSEITIHKPAARASSITSGAISPSLIKTKQL
jgi:hypothetical protein